MLSTLLYFFLALILLVTVHEYGHFQVARWCGVKVLRFSFGFGPVLVRWRDKKNTEFVCSLLPLGGYVKMLDEFEGEVAEHERHLAFNNQPIWKRAAIVLAGPLFNFLFAFVALWLVLVIGIQSLAPMIESVQPNSIAARAGLMAKEEIVALNQTKINSWRDFQYAIMPLIGSQDTIRLTLQSWNEHRQREVLLSLSDWHLEGKKPEPLKSLGIEPFIPSIPPVIGSITADSPAAQSTLRVGDRIMRVDDKPVEDWLVLVDYVRTHPDTQLMFMVQRKETLHTIAVRTGSQKNQGKKEGFLGLRSQEVIWPKHWLRVEREAPLTAVGTALKQTGQLTGATFILMGRLVTGKLGLNTISGPLGIAQGAGDSGRSGFVAYLFFLALMSVSLGALNLLPIPMLDGGHLLYYLLETMFRKPLSEGLKSVGAYLGLLVLVTLMVIALTNDLSKMMS